MHTPPSPPKSDAEFSFHTEEDTLAGKSLGNYRLLERIGMGATALVYRAEHVQLGRIYAVKILHPSISIRPGMRERFLREAKTAGQLNHENIIFIADFAIDPELGPYMVMEYLYGETLQDVLKRDKTIPLPRLKKIMSQVCDALSVAHQAGIIHRDLKPENIFLIEKENGQESIKILDFGLARLAEGATSLTGEGKLLGTPLYMSPEQCRGQSELTPASDIYSFGVMLFELLTGKTPFVGDNPQKLLIDHFLVDPPELPHKYSDSLRQLQAELLAKTPQERPPSISAVRKRLLSALTEKKRPLIAPNVLFEGGHTQQQLPAMTNELAGEVLSELDIIPERSQMRSDNQRTSQSPSFSLEYSGAPLLREEYSTQEQLPAASSGNFTPPPPSITKKQGTYQSSSSSSQSPNWVSPPTPQPNPKVQLGPAIQNEHFNINLTDPHRMTLQENSLSTQDVIRAAQQKPPVLITQRTSPQTAKRQDPLINDLEHLFADEQPSHSSIEISLHRSNEQPSLEADEELLRDLDQGLGTPQKRNEWTEAYAPSVSKDWQAEEPIIELHKKKETTNPSPPPPVFIEKGSKKKETKSPVVRVEKGGKQTPLPPIATSRENRSPSASLQNNQTEIDLSLDGIYDLIGEQGQNLDIEEIISLPLPNEIESMLDSSPLNPTFQEGSQTNLESIFDHSNSSFQIDDFEPEKIELNGRSDENSQRSFPSFWIILLISFAVGTVGLLTYFFALRQ